MVILIKNDDTCAVEPGVRLGAVAAYAPGDAGTAVLTVICDCAAGIPSIGEDDTWFG